MKMSCDIFQEKIIDYIDGTLSATEKKSMDSHLKTCAECSADLNDQLAIKSTMAQYPLKKCPNTVTENVMAQLGNENESYFTTIMEWIRIQVNNFKGYSWKVKYATAVIGLLILTLIMHPEVEKKNEMNSDYSEQEIIRAEKEVKLALGYISHYTNIADEIVREKVISRSLVRPARESMNLTIKTILNGGQNEKDFNL